MSKSRFGSPHDEQNTFERTWQLTCDVYARCGVEVSRKPIRTIRKLTREEWLKSEENATAEFEALTALSEKG